VDSGRRRGHRLAARRCHLPTAIPTYCFPLPALRARTTWLPRKITTTRLPHMRVYPDAPGLTPTSHARHALSTWYSHLWRTATLYPLRMAVRTALPTFPQTTSSLHRVYAPPGRVRRVAAHAHTPLPPRLRARTHTTTLPTYRCTRRGTAFPTARAARRVGQTRGAARTYIPISLVYTRTLTPHAGDAHCVVAFAVSVSHRYAGRAAALTNGHFGGRAVKRRTLGGNAFCCYTCCVICGCLCLLQAIMRGVRCLANTCRLRHRPRWPHHAAHTAQPCLLLACLIPLNIYELYARNFLLLTPTCSRNTAYRAMPSDTVRYAVVWQNI